MAKEELVEDNSLQKKLTNPQLDDLLEKIISYKNAKELPQHDELMLLVDSASSVLENEGASYRPKDEEEKPGGLIDFTDEKYSEVPVVVVPDLHGRADFLIDLMKSDIVKPNVLTALNEKKAFVVCVGDGVHAENRAYERWQKAYKDWEKNNFCGKSMTEEMHEDISTMQGVMELKCAFPECFHFLKGNHENIYSHEGDGDHSFRKFACEGPMVYDFMREYYGDVIIHLISCFEKELPVCAIFNRCGITHAEPRKAYSKKEIINYHKHPSLILDFTWTPNDMAEPGSVGSLFKELNPSCKNKVLWFGGHRPVFGRYNILQHGEYVQIHNPDEMNVALVMPDRDFDFDKDIISVVKSED